MTDREMLEVVERWRKWMAAAVDDALKGKRREQVHGELERAMAESEAVVRALHERLAP